MNILKQKQYNPIPRHRQVIMLVTALAHRIQNMDEQQARLYLDAVCEKAEREDEYLCADIDGNGSFSPEIKQRILEIADSTVV